MKINDLNIIEQLERLAQACPWQRVDIWTTREPEGKYRFTAYAQEETKYGLPTQWGRGNSPEEAVSQLIKDAVIVDPETARKLAVQKLQSQIEALQAVVIGLPPYRPNRELSAINVPQPPATLDV